MAEVGGEAVSEDDDLFEVGLSSVTAAKLRQLLAERLAVDVPPDLVHRFTAVRSLAAALYRLRNDASADDGGRRRAAARRRRVTPLPRRRYCRRRRPP